MTKESRYSPVCLLWQFLPLHNLGQHSDTSRSNQKNLK